ncbi:MAG: ParA family protein [Gammaproteobacteria bacterium]|nr:ParA family protein [Gammaproteobacteria bacterium]
MKVWAVANQKGGVGKTTSVVNLGGLLASRGYRTLLLDMDPHGSMSSYFKLDPDITEDSLYRLFQVRQSRLAVHPKEIVHPTRFENLALLPASTAMATLDRQLSIADGMGLVIARALKLLTPDYDFALIDCPPQLGVLMVNALAACEHLIIPVQTEFLAVKGLERMLRTLDMIGRSGHPAPEYTILPTMFDRRTRASTSTLQSLRECHATNLWRAVIPVDTQFREASRMGIPLTIRSPNDRGSLAYGELLDDLLHPATQEHLSAIGGA